MCDQIDGQRIVVGVDVAKVDQFAAVMLLDLTSAFSGLPEASARRGRGLRRGAQPARCEGSREKLNLDGASEAWPIRTDHERRLHAKLGVLAVYTKEYKRNRVRLESLLSRYWPELPLLLELGSATMLELLMRFGFPRRVADAADQAAELMRNVGGGFLDPDRETLGHPYTALAATQL